MRHCQSADTLRGGNLSVEIFVSEHHGAVHEVSENGHKLAVVAGLKVTPCEVVVLCFGSVGCEHVTQHILLSGEVHEILVKPHRPVARSRNLVAFEVQELIGGTLSGSWKPSP